MEIGKIICCGKNHPDERWRCDDIIGINRLYYIHRGKGGCRHNGKNYPFRPGKLYLIPYTRDFKPYTNPEEPLLHTFADFELMPPVLTGAILSADPTTDSMASAALAVFDTAAAEKRVNPLCIAAIVHLVGYLVERNGALTLQDPVVLQALQTIHARLQEPLRVEELAQACYMNKDSFIRRFARVVGITPYAYLKNLRLHTARSLRAEGLSLAEIARRTGYSDASALLHALKKSPSAVAEGANGSL